MKHHENEFYARVAAGHASSLALSAKEIENYSLARAIRAQATGDWSRAGLEREISEAAKNLYAKQGMIGGGLTVPLEVRLHHRTKASYQQRVFDVGTSTNAGALVQNEVRRSELGDALRPNLVFGKMGITILYAPNGNLTIPRLTATTPTGVLAESATLVSGQPTTADVSMTAFRAAAQVITTKAALITTNEEAEKTLEADIVASLATEIEYLGLNGSGVGQPTGLLNTAGINTSVVGGANGAQIAWSHLTALEAAVAIANAEPNQFGGYVVNPQSRKWMKNTPRSVYLDNIWSGSNVEFPLNGYRAGVTTNVPANLTKGTSVGDCSAMIYGADWSQFLLTLFGPLDVVVDPITKADKGEVAITVTQYFDTGNRQPGGFAVMSDALTA